MQRVRGAGSIPGPTPAGAGTGTMDDALLKFGKVNPITALRDHSIGPRRRNHLTGHEFHTVSEPHTSVQKTLVLTPVSGIKAHPQRTAEKSIKASF